MRSGTLPSLAYPKMSDGDTRVRGTGEYASIFQKPALLARASEMKSERGVQTD